MKNEGENRRSFLKQLLVGATVAAGAVTAIKPAKAKAAPLKRKGKDEVLYHESEHFKTYYKSIS